MKTLLVSRSELVDTKACQGLTTKAARKNGSDESDMMAATR